MRLLAVLTLSLALSSSPHRAKSKVAAALAGAAQSSARPWMVGAFNACGAGPSTPYRGVVDGEMAALRSFATLSFCTNPEDAVRAHGQHRGVTSLLHLGLVPNSVGEHIWNIKCENGGCGWSGPPGQKSGLLDGWESALSSAIDRIGPALRNGSVQGVFLGTMDGL